MGLASEIQASFPRGVTLPNPLQRLCDYIDSKGPPVSRDFQLRPGEDEVLVYWFGGDAAAASRFAGFGAAGDGSIYAYWLGESSDICTAPVVFLAHGGGESLVLASSTEEFLSLLAIGYRDLGFPGMAVGAQGVLGHQVQVTSDEVKNLLIPKPAGCLAMNFQRPRLEK